MAVLWGLLSIFVLACIEAEATEGHTQRPVVTLKTHRLLPWTKLKVERLPSQPSNAAPQFPFVTKWETISKQRGPQEMTLATIPLSIAALFIATATLIIWAAGNRSQNHRKPSRSALSPIIQFSAPPGIGALSRRPLQLGTFIEDNDFDDFDFPEQPKRQPSKKFIAKPFAYHEEIELTIGNLTNLGLGVGRFNGWVVFVPFVLPGERVRVRIFRNHKNYSEADLVEVLEPSPDRVTPKCAVFGQCAGCQYQNLAYEKQLEWKRNQVIELLDHMAGLKGIEVAPTLPSPRQYGYRSKITPHFFRPRPGIPRDVGFLQCGTRGRLVDVPECPIATPQINVKLTEMRKFIQKDTTVYKKGGTLLLRHSGPDTVVTDPCEVCQDRVGNLVFQYPARDFFQNNPFILPDFVAHVKTQALALGATHLVDAYCGCGLFALACADAFEKVAGVEVTDSSIKWAEQNTKLNDISNVTFHLGKAESIFAKVDFPSTSTALVIDPPRKGCSPEFLDQVIKFEPLGLVYVSCNPATQMRDLVRLRAGGYEVVNVQPVDLFPQTRHLECVVTCRKKS